MKTYDRLMNSMGITPIKKYHKILKGGGTRGNSTYWY